MELFAMEHTQSCRNTRTPTNKTELFYTLICPDKYLSSDFFPDCYGQDATLVFKAGYPDDTV
ncbi:MAG: hypothetical protein IEMM0006_2079 [bacterium]|nr:MAG: hypothetical protein IEMM0006_2079 [bacterium]